MLFFSDSFISPFIAHMKKLLIGAIICTTLVIAGCSINGDPKAYNDQLINIHQWVLDQYQVYINDLGSGETPTLTKDRQTTLDTIKKAQNSYATMEWYKWDTDLLQSLVAYMSGLDMVVRNQEWKVISFLFSSSGELTTEQQIEYKGLSDQIEKSLTDLDQKLQQTQETFAKKRNYQLKTIE